MTVYTLFGYIALAAGLLTAANFWLSKNRQWGLSFSIFWLVYFCFQDL